MSATVKLENPPDELGGLIIYLYRAAASWPPEFRSLASLDQPALDRYVTAALERDDATAALASLKRVIPIYLDGDEERGQLLALLRVFDLIFQRIHPRLRVGGPITETAGRVPVWLRTLAERRLKEGCYSEWDGYRLLPRGPLLRMARGEEAANADSMADRFAAIAVVRSTFDHDGRTIHLEHLVVTADPLMGIRGGADPGAERIVHIPLAIDPDDLRATVTTRGLLHLFDFKLAPPGIAGEDTAQHAVDRFLAAASAAQPSDIVIGPEFLVDSAAAAAVGRSLAQTPLNKHRLIAAGSGVTDIGAPGLPWNEMQVFNGLGHPLWSQRKLWPADVLGDVAASLGCPLPAGARGREATRSGDTLVIADVETLGRCVILICQDLKLFPLNALLHDLQCDWALVPILDRGVGEGRWTHQATFGLTEDCQTRFVVGCCVSLGRLLGLPAETPCLMAVGPRNPTESEDTERAFTVKALAPSATSVSIQWREEAWDKTWLRSA